MEFSELYKQTSQLVSFSPTATHIATAVDHRLVIRDAESLQITHLFTCTDSISDIAWAPAPNDDTDLIMCCSFKLGVIQVWSLRDPEWSCVIEEGLGGLTAVRWGTCGRTLLAFSDFQLRITVWSLVTKEASYIQYPKFSNKGFCFRSDGRYFALCERKNCKDTMSIYDADDWILVKHFPVETSDLEDIAWSPDGRFIAAWESILEYKILLYHPDGRLVKRYSAYDTGLGVKCVTWSPSSQFLAIGSFDEKVRLLNNYTWTPLIEFGHPSHLPFPDIPVYRENNMRENFSVPTSGTWLQSISRRTKAFYEEIQPPVQIQSIKIDLEKANPRKGVGICEFNCDGRFVASRNDNMPNTLWLWDVVTLTQIALIQQLAPIRQISWSPVNPNLLAFTTTAPTGSSPSNDDKSSIPFNLYLWGGPTAGCVAVEIPATQFASSALRWAPNGRSLALIDRDKFCIAFLLEDDNNE